MSILRSCTFSDEFYASRTINDDIDEILRQTDTAEVNETELKALFETFIQTFRLSRSNNQDPINEDDDELQQPQQPYYLHQLQTIFENAMSSDSSVSDFPIDLHHIKSSSVKLLKVTIRQPADLIIFMDEVLADMIGRLYLTYEVAEEMIQNRRLTVKVSKENDNSTTRECSIDGLFVKV